jgi:hypothetical protein
LFKPLCVAIESITQTVNAQVDLERHGGHTRAEVIVRILALTADRPRLPLAYRT